MSDNVVQLHPHEGADALATFLTQTELADVRALQAQSAIIGHILFNAESEVLHSENIDAAIAPFYASVFDAGEDGLAGPDLADTIFDGRGMDVTCRTLSAGRLMVFRAKSQQRFLG